MQVVCEATQCPDTRVSENHARVGENTCSDLSLHLSGEAA